MGDNNKFKAFIPIDHWEFEKSDDGIGEMRIGGLASTSSRDREGEIVIQDNLDISQLLNNGFVNFDHNNEKIIGYPDREKTRFTDEGLYIESVLLNGVPLAEEIYKTALALKNSGSDRRYGYSIEGRITKRDPINKDKILKAEVYGVAITPTPCNSDCTWEVLEKSFSSSDSSVNPIINEDLEESVVTDYSEGIVCALLEAYKNNVTRESLRKMLATLCFSTNIIFSRSQSIVLTQILGVDWEDAIINL